MTETFKIKVETVKLFRDFTALVLEVNKRWR